MIPTIESVAANVDLNTLKEPGVYAFAGEPTGPNLPKVKNDDYAELSTFKDADILVRTLGKDASGSTEHRVQILIYHQDEYIDYTVDSYSIFCRMFKYATSRGTATWNNWMEFSVYTYDPTYV